MARVFGGNERAFWRLLVRGAVLLLVTLGIYRFWLATDVRRFLWSNTEIAGDGLEYIGTARELLLGFLIAIALLVPVNVAVLSRRARPRLARPDLGTVALVVLALLGQFAVYRARRYRLTRTVYRGIRFHQTGSAWRYAVCAIFWWAMIAHDARPCLSVRAGEPRALQAAQHLLWRPARPLRRLGHAAVLPWRPVLDRGGRCRSCSA